MENNLKPWKDGVPSGILGKTASFIAKVPQTEQFESI